MAHVGNGRSKGGSAKVELLGEGGVGFWRAIEIHIHGIKPLVLLEGLQAADITKSNFILLVDQDVGGTYRRVTEPILM